MKILFADSFPQDQLNSLEVSGHQCDYQPELDGTTLPAAINDHDVLVVRSTRVTDETLQAGVALKLVIRAGAGTNTIDKDSAAKKQIYVCNVPGKNAVAVAELAMGLMISLDRLIPDNVSDLRAGIWNKKKYAAARGLFGQTLGIIGLGAIGLALAERAHAFAITLLVVAKSTRSQEVLQRLEALKIEQVANQNDLLSRSDIVSLHLPATPATKHTVNENFLAAMKPCAMLINTSRAEIIDETALITAINQKNLRVGLDVFANEPVSGKADFNSTLAGHTNVYGTHHIGASTMQAQQAVADGVLKVISAFAKGQIINCVNLST